MNHFFLLSLEMRRSSRKRPSTKEESFEEFLHKDPPGFAVKNVTGKGTSLFVDRYLI